MAFRPFAGKVVLVKICTGNPYKIKALETMGNSKSSPETGCFELW
jgi:hypothetical protein